jgi:hypothetical protein
MGNAFVLRLIHFHARDLAIKIVVVVVNDPNVRIIALFFQRVYVDPLCLLLHYNLAPVVIRSAPRVIIEPDDGARWQINQATGSYCIVRDALCIRFNLYILREIDSAPCGEGYASQKTTFTIVS